MTATKIIWLLGAGTAVAVTAAWLYSAWSFNTFATLGDRGLYGDSFGAFNAVVGALGFGAVAYSLYRQQKQITEGKEDQRRMEEIALKQIDQMIRSNAALVKQGAAQTRQARTMEFQARTASAAAQFEIYENMVSRLAQVLNKRYGTGSGAPEATTFTVEEFAQFCQQERDRIDRNKRRKSNPLNEEQVEELAIYMQLLQRVLEIKKKQEAVFQTMLDSSASLG